MTEGKNQRPPHRCNKAGCKALTRERYCAQHAVSEQRAWAREHDRRRVAEGRTAAARGYGHRWRLAREGWLREHPVCAGCGGPANAVDHIRRVSGPEDPGFWDRQNWQSLCHACHNRKTIAEDGGLGRAKTARP